MKRERAEVKADEIIALFKQPECNHEYEPYYNSNGEYMMSRCKFCGDLKDE
mgnify:CR=1 FL=1